MRDSEELVRALTPEEQKNRGWKVFVNGKEQAGAAIVEIRNEQLGISARYGMRPEGYDGIVIGQPGGGGSVIVPWVNVVGWMPYVGVLLQERVLQGGLVLNLPRGMIDPGETHLQAAGRELQEELADAGVDARMLTEIRELEAEPGNPDSAYHDTSKPEDGIHFFEVEVNPHLLESDGTGGYKFKDERVVSASTMGEKILQCRFIRWDEAARLSDLLTRSGVALLVAHRFANIRPTDELF